MKNTYKVYLKSGHVIEVYATSFLIIYDKETGKALEYNVKGSTNRCLYFDLDEIAAVVG